MACPYARDIKGAVAYCSLLGKKVSTLRYPCKGRYQRCPVYRARAPRETIEVPQPPPPIRPEEKPRAEEAKPEAKPVEPVEAPQGPEAPQAPAPSESAVEAPQAGATSEEAQPSEAEAAEEAKRWRSEKLVEQACDALTQASLVAFAEVNNVFSGSLEELLRLSTDYEGKIVYFRGRAGEREVGLLVYQGVLIGAHSTEPEGGVTCGDKAIEGLSLSTMISGIVYIASLTALPALQEAVKAVLG